MDVIVTLQYMVLYINISSEIVPASIGSLTQVLIVRRSSADRRIKNRVEDFLDPTPHAAKFSARESFGAHLRCIGEMTEVVYEHLLVVVPTRAKVGEGECCH